VPLSLDGFMENPKDGCFGGTPMTTSETFMTLDGSTFEAQRRILVLFACANFRADFDP
jgi:hypothetical protein